MCFIGYHWSESITIAEGPIEKIRVYELQPDCSQSVSEPAVEGHY